MYLLGLRVTASGCSDFDFEERYFAQYKGPPCFTNGRGRYPIEYSVIVNAG